jgi:hypothetical protein
MLDTLWPDMRGALRVEEGHPAYLEGGRDAVSALTGVWGQAPAVQTLAEEHLGGPHAISAHGWTGVGERISSSVACVALRRRATDISCGWGYCPASVQEAG